MLLNEERLKLSAAKLQPLICYWKLFIMAGCCTGNLRNAWPPLQWRHNGRDSVSNHQPHDCLLNRLFRHRSKKTSKLRVTGLCAGNSPGTGGFPAQMASNAEKCFHLMTSSCAYSFHRWFDAFVEVSSRGGILWGLFNHCEQYRLIRDIIFQTIYLHPDISEAVWILKVYNIT